MIKQVLTIEELKQLGAIPIDKKRYEMVTMSLQELKELGASPIIPKKIEPQIVEKIVEKTIEKVVVDDKKIEDLSQEFKSTLDVKTKEVQDLVDIIQKLQKKVQILEQNSLGTVAGLSPLISQQNGRIVSSFTGVLNFIGATLSMRRDGGVDITIPSGATYNNPTSGNIDGINTVFGFASAPNLIISDGRTLFEGHGYSLAGLVATLDNAPQEYIKSI